MPRWPAARLAALLVAAGCGGGAPAPIAVQPAPADSAPPLAAGPSLGAAVDAARRVVEAFVAAEAQHDLAADTLLAPEADFIMSGIVITRRPRLAAIVGRGTAVVEEARAGLAGAFAYVVVVYRFDSPSPGLRDRARGTFVLERRPAGWRIRHAHSSMVERW